MLPRLDISEASEAKARVFIGSLRHGWSRALPEPHLRDDFRDTHLPSVRQPAKLRWKSSHFSARILHALKEQSPYSSISELQPPLSPIAPPRRPLSDGHSHKKI